MNIIYLPHYISYSMATGKTSSYYLQEIFPHLFHSPPPLLKHKHKQ